MNQQTFARFCANADRLDARLDAGETSFASGPGKALITKLREDRRLLNSVRSTTTTPTPASSRGKLLASSVWDFADCLGSRPVAAPAPALTRSGAASASAGKGKGRAESPIDVGDDEEEESEYDPLDQE